MPKRAQGENGRTDVIGDAVQVMKIATEEVEKDENGKDKAAQSLGRRGGKARAVAIDPARRREIARHAAKARWSKNPVDG